MLNFLTKPSPILFSSQVRLIISIGIAAFVFGFLIIFEPFSVFEYLLVSKFTASAGFGAITLFFNLVFFFGWNQWFIRKYEYKWTTWKQLLSIFIHVSIIALANVWYTKLIFSPEANQGFTLLERFGQALFYSHSIAFMPVMFMLTYTELRLSNVHSEQSKDFFPNQNVEREIQVVQIKIENSTSVISLSSDNFKFAKASGNYVEFFYSTDGKLVKDLQRLTLSSFEKQIANSALNVMKTHRSYVVNLDAIEDVKGNAQGFLLKLYGTEEQVPVSRNNINDFNVLMKG